MKRDNKIFYKLRKDLKKIRNNSHISNYERWTKSRDIIDQFYNKNSVDLESLYDRMLGLKKRKERNSLITIPIFISVVFGVFVTIGFDVIKNYFTMWKEFLAQMDEKLAASILKLGEIQELVDMHGKIVRETSEKLFVLLIVLFLVLLAGAFLVVRIFYFYHDLKFLYYEVCDYEINRIKRMLDGIEEKEGTEAKAFLNLENSKYILTYELVNVTKR